MGYSTRQINGHFNNFVELYKLAGYKEVHCPSIHHCSNILRSCDLTYNNLTLKLSLCRCTLDKVCNYSVPYYDIILETFSNFKHESVETISRFYQIDSDYFVTDIDEAVRAINKHLYRITNNTVTAIGHCIKSNRLSDRASSYLLEKVNHYMNNIKKSGDYLIHSTYFSKSSKYRKLAIVIKHKESGNTETLYFKI